MKAQASDFLRGSNDKNWSADFDWMIADANMAKILDGNYDNSKRPRSKGRGFTPTDINGQYDSLPPAEVITV